MSAPWWQYNLNAQAPSTQAQLYGIITSIPVFMKGNCRIGGWIQGVGGDRYNAIGIQLDYKVNGGSAQVITSKTASGADTGQVSFEFAINLSNVTKLGFNFNGSASENTTFKSYIWISATGDITTETYITAAKMNAIAEFVGSTHRATAGNAITRDGYANIAWMYSIPFPVSDYPYANDLATIVNSLNSRGYSKSWDSTAQRDY